VQVTVNNTQQEGRSRSQAATTHRLVLRTIQKKTKSLKQISVTPDDLYAFKTLWGIAISTLHHLKCWFSSLHRKVGSHGSLGWSLVGRPRAGSGPLTAGSVRPSADLRVLSPDSGEGLSEAHFYAAWLRLQRLRLRAAAWLTAWALLGRYSTSVRLVVGGLAAASLSDGGRCLLLRCHAAEDPVEL
jgi:hypothetical protein